MWQVESIACLLLFIVATAIPAGVTGRMGVFLFILVCGLSVIQVTVLQLLFVPLRTTPPLYILGAGLFALGWLAYLLREKFGLIVLVLFSASFVSGTIGPGGKRTALRPGFPFWPSWSVYDSRLPAAMQRFSHCCQVRYSFRCRSGLRMLADHGVPAKPEGPLATPLPRRPSATRVRWLFRAVDVTLRAQVAPKSAAACRRTTSGSDAPPQAATNNIARASRAVRPSSSADAASSSATSF